MFGRFYYNLSLLYIKKNLPPGESVTRQDTDAGFKHRNAALLSASLLSKASAISIFRAGQTDLKKPFSSQNHGILNSPAALTPESWPEPPGAKILRRLRIWCRIRFFAWLEPRAGAGSGCIFYESNKEKSCSCTLIYAALGL